MGNSVTKTWDEYSNFDNALLLESMRRTCSLRQEHEEKILKEREELNHETNKQRV